VYLALPVVDPDGVLVGVVRGESLRELEWSRTAPAPGAGSRLVGAVRRGVSDLLGGRRGEGGG
jgi:hypothetical protein